MATANRLSAEYVERVEHKAKLQALKRLERLRGLMTEGGRMAFEIPISPEIASQLAALSASAPEPAAPPIAGVV